MSAVALALNRRRAPPPPGGKTSTDGGSPNYDELKLKYMTVDRNYENLKRLTRKGMLREEFQSLVASLYGCCDSHELACYCACSGLAGLSDVLYMYRRLVS